MKDLPDGFEIDDGTGINSSNEMAVLKYNGSNKKASQEDRDAFIANSSTTPSIPTDNTPSGTFASLPSGFVIDGESSYGDVLSKAGIDARLGIMRAIGGGMQAIGEAPISATQTLSKPQPELPENPTFSDYLSKYATYPVSQTLAKGELAASAIPASIAPSFMDILANSGKQIQQEATAQTQENRPNVIPGSLKAKIGTTAEMGAQMLPILAAAGIAPASIPALFAAQGFGSTYADQTNAGKTGGEALLPSVASATANMAIGDIPMGILTKEGGGLAAKLLKAGIAGEITSQGLNAVQQGINKGTIDPNMTWDQYKQSVEDISGVGAALGVVGGGIAHPFTKGVESATVPSMPNEEASPYSRPTKQYNADTGRMEDLVAPASNIAKNVAPTTEALQQAATPEATKTPSIIDQIKTGEIDAGGVRDLLQSGAIQFKDGRLQETVAPTEQPSTNNAQSIIDAISSGGNVDSGMVRNLLQTGELQFKDGRLQAAHQLSPTTNIDTATSTLQAIKSGDLQNVHSDTIRDFLKSGEVTYGQNGQLELTELGHKLHDEVNQLGMTPKEIGEINQYKSTPQSVPEKSFRQLLESSNTPIADLLHVNPQTGERVLPSDSRATINQQKLERSIKGNAQPVTQELPKKELPVSEVPNDQNRVGITPNEGSEARAVAPQEASPVLEAATPSEEKAIADYQNAKQQEIPFSVTKKTDSPEFKKWFGDSKVVDGNGDPMVVYHGTNNDVHNFDRQHSGKNSGQSGQTDGVFWFGNKGKANHYANLQNHEEALKLAPSPDNIKDFRDFIVDATKELTGDSVSRDGVNLAKLYGADLATNILEKAEGNYNKQFSYKNSTQYEDALNSGGNVVAVHLKMENPLVRKDVSDSETGDVNDLLNEAHKNGHDGLILKDSYAVFDPTQIKSAISNNGNYDPKDPRISYSKTPSDKFTQQKDQIKTKVTDIIKKINPSVDVNLVDKMFGEGAALKASGAKDTNRQEVAGAYDKLNNIVHASLNTEKWNPHDTAYHEAYHSIRDMITPTDDAILQKAFPGTDKLSQSEHEAVEFARFMTEKNATGFIPAVRRIFSAIRQALRSIGQTLKLGKFNSVDDIFNRVESGNVYKDYQDAIRSGDIESLSKSELTPQQQEEAIKAVSPELHDVVYSGDKLSPDDANALKEVADSNLPPEQLMYSLGNDVYNKASANLEKTKEKMLRTSVDMLRPFASKEFIEAKLADVDNTIMRTGKQVEEASSPVGAFNDITRMLTTSNDAHIRWIGERYLAEGKKALKAGDAELAAKHEAVAKQLNEIGDMFYPAPGSGRDVAQTYHEEIDTSIHRSLNEMGFVLKGLNEADLGKVTYLMQHPEEMNALGTDKGVGRSAAVLADIVQELRDNLASAGYEVPEVKGFFPRIYDTAKVVANEARFKELARKAYYETYKDEIHDSHPKVDDTIKSLTKKQQSYEKKVLSDPKYAYKKTESGTTYKDLFEKRAKRLEKLNKNYSTSPDVYVGNMLTEMVDKWFNNITLQDVGIAQNGHDFSSIPSTPPAPSSFKGRTLSKETDNIMREFLLQNPVDAMTGLIYSSARKAAWERRFGGDKWNTIRQNLVNNGADGNTLHSVIRNIQSNTGQLGVGLNGRVKDALALARYYSSLRYLSKATLASMTEPALSGIRTGNIGNIFKAYGLSVRQFIGKGDKAHNLSTLSQLLGITGEAAENMLMMQRMGGIPNQKVGYASKRWYDRIALTKWTAATKEANVAIMKNYLGTLAKDIVDHKDSYKSSDFFIRELGIPADKVESFSKWLNDNGGKKVESSLILDKSENANLYRGAMRRAIDQTIQNPTAATRQRWASHPVGSMAYNLTAFNMAFSKNVLIRAGRLTKEAATGKGYSLQDRLRLAAPMMMLPTMYLLGSAYSELRDELFPPAKKRTAREKTGEHLSKSGLTGNFDPLIQAISGNAGYGKSLADFLIGPTLKNVTDAATGAISAAKAPFDHGKNSNKRKAAQTFYSMVAAPAISGAVATYSPYAIPAFAAIQAMNSPQLRNKFVDTIAGKKKQP